MTPRHRKFEMPFPVSAACRQTGFWDGTSGLHLVGKCECHIQIQARPDGPPLPGTASIRGFRAAVTADVRYSRRAYRILNALQDVLKVLADLLG